MKAKNKQKRPNIFSEPSTLTPSTIFKISDPKTLNIFLIFSQYLFAFGLDIKPIISILDNSPIKIGKRLYGYDIDVNSPKILSNYKNYVGFDVSKKALEICKEKFKQDSSKSFYPISSFNEEINRAELSI